MRPFCLAEVKRRWLCCFAYGALLCSGPAWAIDRITLSLGELRHDTITASSVTLDVSLQGSGPLRLHAERLTYGERQWRDVTLVCERPVLKGRGQFECPAGQLTTPATRLPLAFSLDTAAQSLSLALNPAAGGRWQISADWRSPGWRAKARLDQAQLKDVGRLAPMPLTLARGNASGQVTIASAQRGLDIQGALALADLAFNNDSGSLAAEALALDTRFHLQQQSPGWRWDVGIDWRSGELYTQPLYFAQGGHRLQARGTLDEAKIKIDEANIMLAEVGEAALSADWRRDDKMLSALTLHARNLASGPLYELLLKPYLAQTMLADLEMAGRLDAQMDWQQGRLQAFDVALREFDVEDKKGRFALYKVNARVPWTLKEASTAQLRYEGGYLLKLPLGKTDLAANLNGYSLTAPQLKVPVMDGWLTLSDVSAAFINQDWHWHLGAALSPVSMRDFSHAVGWPPMEGKLAAGFPLATYSNGKLRVEGGIGFDIFDGSVVVRGLQLDNPLGAAPRLQTDIEMRNLDLDLLTRTFSFGAMTGRLDGDVKNLILSRWEPVQFDADFRSSPGRYPKKISQRAVQNISALGGAGAAAAIQRSFLRFFEEFNYSKLGLSCQLRNGVCRMDGVEPAQSGYVIVKGSGIPAITVLGYNRSVSWGELLDRIKRVTTGNVAPVIQ